MSLLAGVVAGAIALAAQAPEDYQIGPQDVLAIAVWNQEDLGGRYAVEADGTFTFPFVGRVTAGGLTLREFEAELTRLLADGFFRRPQVTVAVDEYRSQQVFVVGEVRSPGTYSLEGEMTLIEALARAGSTTERASTEALVVRRQSATGAVSAPDGESTAGPTLPDQLEADGSGEVLRVDIEALQSGRLADNLALRDGDTVFIPRAETVFVFGEVNAPGEFPLRRMTTVLQALALAGGVTEYGATNRIKIIRMVDGEQQELDVELSAPVQAGDTIVVPERFI